MLRVPFTRERSSTIRVCTRTYICSYSTSSVELLNFEKCITSRSFLPYSSEAQVFSIDCTQGEVCGQRDTVGCRGENAKSRCNIPDGEHLASQHWWSESAPSSLVTVVYSIHHSLCWNHHSSRRYLVPCCEVRPSRCLPLCSA